MNIGFVLGRIALVVIFVVLGVTKLMDLNVTADAIAKIPIPASFDATATQIATQVRTTTGMAMPQILALLVGGLEVLAGVLIACNVLTRTAAIVLLIYTAAGIFYFHDFWNLAAGAEKTNQMLHALKNLAIIGALLMLASWPRRTVVVEELRGHDHLQPL